VGVMKKFGVISSVFVLLVFASTFVSAQAPGVWDAIQNFFVQLWEKVLQPFFTFILGQVSTGEILLAKILLTFLVLIFVSVAVRAFPPFQGKRGLAFLTSFIISVLAIRFIATEELVKTILLPYTALGIAITAFLPLVIYFYFVEKVVPVGVYRKLAWIFSIVVFGSLYITRFDELGESAYIYLIAAGVSLIFLWFDSTIQRWFRKAQLERMEVTTSEEGVTKLRRKLVELKQDFTEGIITEDEYNKRRAQYSKRIYALSK